MVRHIVAWNYKPGFTEAENKLNAQKIKSELEALTECVGGIIYLKVYTDTLASSNRSIMLDSMFKNEQALEAYQIHPKHTEIIKFIRTVTEDRTCIDYYE